MLFDKDFRLQFVNRQVMEFQNYPPDVIRPGILGEDILRFQIKRGDFGPVKDVEAKVRERVALIRKPGGNRFLRRTLEGRYIEFNFLPLDDGGLLAFGRDVTSLKEREEALAAAKDAAEKRARRRRAHARGDADRARQHERRRHAVGQGFPLAILQPLLNRDVGLQRRRRCMPGVSGFDMIRELSAQGEFGHDRRYRAYRHRGNAAHPEAGWLALRAANSDRQVHRIQLPAVERWRPARHLPRHHRAKDPRGSARVRPRKRPKTRAMQPRRSAPKPKPPTRRNRPSSPP